MTIAEPEGRVPPPDPESFGRIADLIYRQVGIRLGPGKGYFVEGRLGRLYRELGCRDWADLCRQLEAAGAGARRDAFIDAVVTGETQFFRDELPFRALAEKILPEARQGADQPLRFRVWSAGCSTGQEPFSIAMALWDCVERGAAELDIWATDVSAASLRRAQDGVYDELELARGLSAERRRRFFEELPGRGARVGGPLRRAVRFQRLNLATDPVCGPGFHAVFCRNVAIYFDTEGKRRLHQTLESAVAPGGYLILGAAETQLLGRSSFRVEHFHRCLLFRKAGGARP
ncbi:MAG: protein-glutamate O-methyltransferase CheR [Deltaproteobacteria bacterium]|nr:protein-glutamate O-methyltransferase CheR [Deltaproteobacteria bacterium]